MQLDKVITVTAPVLEAFVNVLCSDCYNALELCDQTNKSSIRDIFRINAMFKTNSKQFM